MLRSAAIRNVHDVVMALGLGADGVCPYVMVEVICVEDYDADVSNLCAALRKGIEKVISTIGIHELRGYARQFSSIGVKPELAEILQCETFCSSERAGVGFARLDGDTDERFQILGGEEELEAGEGIASTRRSTRLRSRPLTAPPHTRTTPRRSVTWSSRARSPCVTS